MHSEPKNRGKMLSGTEGIYAIVYLHRCWVDMRVN